MPTIIPCMEILLLLLILFSATLLFVTRWLPTEITAVLIVGALVLTGILSAEQALSGFSSTATLTVGAMFVLSAGLMRTGALEMVTIQLARFSQGSTTRLLVLLALVVPVASAFVNNTPVVVMMVPVILSLSRRFKVRPSKLLLPVSYFAIVGGTVTLLGTSTNILIDDMYRKAGGPGFGLFEFTPLGLIYAAVCAIFVIVFSQKLLPDRAPSTSAAGERYQLSRFITELIVDEASDLVGRSVEGLFGGLPNRFILPRPVFGRHHRRVRRLQPTDAQRLADERVELLEVLRDGRVFRGDEGGGLVLQPGDILLISGTPPAIARFLDQYAPRLATVGAEEDGLSASVEQRVVEAVVLPGSSASGQLARGLELYTDYEVKMMALKRRGDHWRGLRSIRLQDGDVLLLQGTPKGLQKVSDALRLLLIEGVDEAIVRTAKNRIALLIMLAVVLLAAFTGLPIVILALAGAALMVVTRCLRLDEAFRSLDPATLMLLVGTIPLGLALQSTGLAATIVEQMLLVLGDTDPRLFLSLFYLLTSLLTELISNNAVAVLLTPIAMQLALSMGIDPKPLLMAIAFGASASFMTPMGYQTNAIVMGPGGYVFKDYLKIGTLLNLLMWVVATFLIPVFWPL